LFNFKQLIKLILYFFVDILVESSKDISKNKILLIRLDAIGDYVLFRNFIESIKTHVNYKDYSLTLLGNLRWKSLAEELDSEYIANFIWLDRNKFSKNLFYRYLKLREISSEGYEFVLSPVYSREFFSIDSIVKKTNSQNKIGFSGDFSNITRWQKSFGDRYYTKLIEGDDEIVFEFLRNKFFFEVFLDSEIQLTKPTIEMNDKAINFKLPEKFVVLFIGAGEKFRQYSTDNFVKIANYLYYSCNYEIVLCGGSADTRLARDFGESFEGEYLDLVSKTTLSAILRVINLSDMIISNDSSAHHIAVALGGIKVIVISNGNHYGRFTPYPKSITDRHTVLYPPSIENNKHKNQELIDSYGYSSNLDINDIDVNKVIKQIDEALLS
jgi:ADP-heptose:LPS heptosyltransferase